MTAAQFEELETPVVEAVLRWRFEAGTAAIAQGREERFPELWSAQPARLWRLAVGAKAAVVVGFAARALIENAPFIDAMPTADIADLLVDWEPFAERREFGHKLAERRISIEGLKPALAAALMADSGRGGALVKLYLGGRPDILVVVGGVIPPDDYQALRDAGAAEIFGPGTVIADAAISLIDRLEDRK